jgi:hypothetical protein
LSEFRGNDFDTLKIVTNILAIMQSDLVVKGATLDLLLANVNHSCDPNATVLMEGPKTFLRALKPIAKNEEVFINYIDPLIPFYYRQKKLQDQYYFKCLCPVCKRGPNLAVDTFLGNNNFSQASKDYQEQIKAYLAQHADILDLDRYSERCGSDDISGKFAAAEDKAESEYEDIQKLDDSKKQIGLLEKFCRNLNESKIWPVFRYPYMNARSDLVNAYARENRFLDALKHVAKLRFDVYNHLIPPHHPSAVLSDIMLFKLIVNVSMTKDAPPTEKLPFDVTAALIRIGNDAMENIVKSYGREFRISYIFSVMFRQVSTEIKMKDKDAFRKEQGEAALQGLKKWADELDI